MNRRNTGVLNIEHAFCGYNNKVVLREVNLSIIGGEIVCVLGPSGSGKSTLLKTIAGLLSLQSGEIRINGENQAHIPPYRRDIGFVFQSSTALFPHLNVYENVAFPFRRGGRRLTSEPWQNAVARILDITHLKAHETRSIKTLSGGELQRVALARSIVYQPTLLLLDEPLSFLDNPLKADLLDLLFKLHEEFDTTFLYVTHDEREALAIATHIAVIHDEEIRQFASASDVIDRPRTKKIAQIIGGWNFLHTDDVDRIAVDLPAHVDTPNATANGTIPRELGVPVRATTLTPAPRLDSDHISLPAEIRRKRPYQGGWHYECVLAKTRIASQRIPMLAVDSAMPFELGSPVFVTFQKESLYAFNH